MVHGADEADHASGDAMVAAVGEEQVAVLEGAEVVVLDAIDVSEP